MLLVIASHNTHKIRELRSMLRSVWNGDILSLLDFPLYKPIEEHGSSLKEIATLKALNASKTLGHWAFADDSGLFVPALNGAPGIFSRRYAGEHATDIENRRKLLKEMNQLEDMERQAYFECCLALSAPEGLRKCVSGRCEGFIATQEKGGQGFGYDPIFIKHGYNKTLAELEEEIKNRISHRRKAFDKLLSSFELILKCHKT